MCVQTDDLDWFAEKAQWKDLRSAIMVEEKRMDAKGETNDVRLYVSSLPSDPERAQRCVRAHWGIENSLHWTLDVVFREDECRVRTGNGAENFSLMRHLIAGVLKVEGDKTGASVGESVFSGVCAQERVFARVFGEIERRECV